MDGETVILGLVGPLFFFEFRARLILVDQKRGIEEPAAGGSEMGGELVL